MQKLAWLALSIALALPVAGCGDDDPGSQPDMTAVPDLAAPIPTNFDTLYNQVLGPSCAAFTVCHTTGNREAAGLDMTKLAGNDPYLALVGAPAQNARAKSEGLLRVKPCDADNSFIIKKLELPRDLDDKTDYGYRMPVSNPALSPALIKAFRDWINRGALRNEPVGTTGSTCTLNADGGVDGGE